MDWIVQTQSFPHIKSLCVHLTRDDLHVERPLYTEQAISFFRSFEPLEQLTVDGPLDSQIIDAVLARHGQTLTKLSIHPFEELPNCRVHRKPRQIPFQFTKDCILHVRAQCPVLVELTIPVRRNMSSSSEAELYKCFGVMKALRALNLILDCSNWRVFRDPTYKPVFFMQDRYRHPGGYPWVKLGDLKETFINCAIDEALARSIWNIISQNKDGKPLERLKLRPAGMGEFGSLAKRPSSLGAFYNHLARSWSIERDPRDNREDCIIIRELQRDRRLATDRDEARLLAQFPENESLAIFRSVWPSRDGSKDEDFHDDWSSFPLQQTSQA
jgi:hypothetical protein